jgi:hypothetical protein
MACLPETPKPPWKGCNPFPPRITKGVSKTASESRCFASVGDYATGTLAVEVTASTSIKIPRAMVISSGTTIPWPLRPCGPRRGSR